MITCELSTSLSESVFSDGDDIPIKNKKKWRSRQENKNPITSSMSTTPFHDDVWSVTSSGKSSEDENLWNSWRICKQKMERATTDAALVCKGFGLLHIQTDERVLAV